jgi:hypothetical protein
VVRVRECVFCGSPATGRGEHVFPIWFLERWHGQGPFTQEVNAAPIRRRDGSIQRREEATRVMLAVCGSCNAWLNKGFEIPAKLHVRAILDRFQVLDAAATMIFARWWVKTLLLSRHPASWSSFPGERPARWDFPVDLLPAMRRTDELPADLSLWMAIFDTQAEAGRLPRRLRIDLPRTSREDGSGGRGQSALWGTPLPNGTRLVLQLVFHPLCDFEHPFEAAGLSTRLWPGSPSTLDVSAHRAIDPVGNAQLEGLFTNLGAFVGVPPGGRVLIHCRADSEPLDLCVVFGDEK